MSKFHINNTGAVSMCRAQAKCPFGGPDVHFASIADARKGYEDAMASATVPPGASKDRGLSELNSIVKATQDEAILREAIERGSDRTLTNLARNPHATASVLAAAAEKASSPTTRQVILKHPAYPVEAMTSEDFKYVWDSDPSAWGARDRLLASDALTDEMLEAVNNPADRRAIVNVNNKLSQSKIVQLSEGSWTTLQYAVESGRYPLRERLEYLSLEQIRPLASKASSAADLRAIAAKTLTSEDTSWNRHVQWAVAANKHTDAATLATIVEHSKDTDTLVSAYRNGNTSAAARKAAVKKNEAVASLDRVKHLDQKLGGKLGEQLGRTSEAADSLGRQRVIRFDPEKVAALKISSKDIDVYVRYYQGNYLFGATYDEKTGRYVGWID